jgi:hypothetical protein
MFRRILWIVLQIVAGVLKWVLWLPLLTIYLADERIRPRVSESFMILCGIGWLICGLFPLMNIKGEFPWTNVFILDAFFYGLLGAIVFFA